MSAKRNAPTYKVRDQRTHVYLNPGMYVDSDQQTDRNVWVFDFNENRIIQKNIRLPHACEQIYLEIITNAADNAARSYRNRIDPKYIQVDMTHEKITVTNFGNGISYEMIDTPDGPKTSHFAVFGCMLSSSNYDVQRSDAGVNGIGAKACNIFSKFFELKAGNARDGVYYHQIWYDNMTKFTEPEIKFGYTGETYVQISYIMDFARFGYLGDQAVYTQEIFELFARRLLDMSFTCKIPVIFNGKRYNFNNIRDYARLYFGEKVDTGILHYQWPEPIEGEKIMFNGDIQNSNLNLPPDVELIAMDTPDDGLIISFVNSLLTQDGGVHVNEAISNLSKTIVESINTKTIEKMNKIKEKDVNPRTLSLTIKNVKPHVSMILSVRVKDPVFNSQSKNNLKNPTPKIEIPERILSNMNRWNLHTRLNNEVEARKINVINNTKNKKFKSNKRGEDANLASRANQGYKCTLLITEGDSGACYARKYIGFNEGGKDIYGVLPMKGKVFNVHDKDVIDIYSNKELNELRHMLNLQEGTDYTVDENFITLRYGRVIIMADSDDDGKHIIGLILMFFQARFPSLLYRGYLFFLRTPILILTQKKKNGQKLKFYTSDEYFEWRDKNPDYKKWEHNYYKGLGTSEDSEIKDNITDERLVQCFYDINAPERLDLAFNKKRSNDRKNWIMEWVPARGYECGQVQPISYFIDYEMIKFSISDIQRSIPRLADGLKESTRKIVAAATRKWNIGSGSYTRFKVSQFSGYIASEMQYHHGESILAKVITGMAQRFTGSNNIALFEDIGQFGCLDPKTKIITTNGIKMVSDLHWGDQVINEFGQPQKILKFFTGQDMMYEVIQNHGFRYRVNSQHILTLIYKNEIVDIKVTDFLKLSKNQQRKYQGIRIFNSHTIENHDDLYRNGYNRIRIQKLSVGDYFGFMCEGTERFLLSDGTITHNSRATSGKDAADGRYIHTNPSRLFQYIFRKEDQPILTKKFDEGHEIEPENFWPVVPMVLINGANGIGTGFSTTILNHNPIDIINWLKARLTDDFKNFPDVLPWYYGFSGAIYVFDRNNRNNSTRVIDVKNRTSFIVDGNQHYDIPVSNPENELTNEEKKDDDKKDENEVEEYYNNENVRLSMLSQGRFEIEDDIIYIDELPIGVDSSTYRTWLEKMIETKEISAYRDLSNSDDVYFEIEGFNKEKTFENLKLQKTIGISNMYLLDSSNTPIRYETSYDILESFYIRRLKIYEKRKEYQISKFRELLVDLNYQLKLVTSIVDGKLVISNCPIEEIELNLEQLKIPIEYFEKAKISRLTKNNIINLQNKIANTENDLQKLIETKPHDIWYGELEELQKEYIKEYPVIDQRKNIIRKNENLSLKKTKGLNRKNRSKK